MTDVPGAGLIGLLAGLALNALGRWSERPCPEPTEPVGEFDPWMFTSDQRRHSRYARESSKILQGLVATGSDVPIVEPERRKLAWRRSKLEQPKAPASGLTLSQAAERYLAAKARKRSVTNDRRILEHFKTEFGKDIALVEITGSRISEYRAQRLTATRGQGARPLSAAAVNRPLALLRHLLRLACDEWEVLLTAPKIRLEKEPQGRLPVVDTRGRGQAARGVPGAEERRLADLAELALYTGMRRGELLGLTWDRVDRARGVVLLERTKSGRRREVPLNAPADAILARRAPDTLRDGFVFGTHSWYTFRGHWQRLL
jgi:integrase